MKHEAWLGRVADAGGGSYALETITDFMAREGWKVMQDIEARGGFRTAQGEGMFAQALQRGLAAREQAVALRRRVLVGTNQYAIRPSGRWTASITALVNSACMRICAERVPTKSCDCARSGMRLREAIRHECCWRRSAM